MPEIRIEARGGIDDAALTQLHARAFGTEPGPVTPWRARLERHSVGWACAFAADRLVGFVHACTDGGAHAFLLDTVVDPQFQGRGIGRRLVAVVTDLARESGCQWLHVDHTAELTDFYRRCGFGPTAAGLIALTPR